MPLLLIYLAAIPKFNASSTKSFRFVTRFCRVPIFCLTAVNSSSKSTLCVNPITRFYSQTYRMNDPEYRYRSHPGPRVIRSE